MAAPRFDGAKRLISGPTWEQKVSYRPTPAQVRALHASHGVHAVLGRWGEFGARTLRDLRLIAERKTEVAA